MFEEIHITSDREFRSEEFKQLLGMETIIFTQEGEDEGRWLFYNKGTSLSQYMILMCDDCYYLFMDQLATYDDYKLFPYLADTLSVYLTDNPYIEDGKTAYQLMDDDWIEDNIGKGIAYLKCILHLGARYYMQMPVGTDGYPFLTEHILNEYGVTIHSSTPRIYGYLMYLQKNNLLPVGDAPQVDLDEESREEVVEVPQHVSIGTVLSWQTDGSHATESYSREDVDLLLSIADKYKNGRQYTGVVLNDIGTIYEYAIGVERDAGEAIYWFKEAMKHGDRLYAPSSLGDIYRRGLDNVKCNLALALDAYRQSDDPYAWYRIGQSYEEGWTGETDMKKAMQYYRKAAAVGHHLALRRLECEEE